MVTTTSKGKEKIMKKTEDIVVELLTQMLDKGISPWHQPWVNGTARSINGNAYRGWNAILLGLQNYSDPRYLTFNKAKSLGGKIKKGAKGHFVCFYQFVEKEKQNDDGTTTKYRYPYAKGYTVFNVEQCENLNIKPFKGYNINNNPIELAEKIWSNYADKPELQHNLKSAFYKPIGDYISIPDIKQFESSEAYYATLFHEAIHSTGAKHRLNRDLSDYHTDKQVRGYEELVAEIGSQILCQNIGITKTLQNSASYCKSWSNAIKNEIPAKSVLSAASTAQKAVDYILGIKYDTENAD